MTCKSLHKELGSIFRAVGSVSDVVRGKSVCLTGGGDVFSKA